MLVADNPFGNISDYLSSHFGAGAEEYLSFWNIVLTLSERFTVGSVKTSFSYDEEDWGNRFAGIGIDLLLGFRIKLLPNFVIIPRGGLGGSGILRIDKEGKGIDDIQASFGIAFEHLLAETEIGNFRLAYVIFH